METKSKPTNKKKKVSFSKANRTKTNQRAATYKARLNHTSTNRSFKRLMASLKLL